MRAVIQRVSHASVTIDGVIKSKIGQGFLYVAYNISNYSIYDSRRNIMINGNRVHDFPERRFTGTLSIGANISF